MLKAVRRFVAQPSIRPALYYSGKIAGYVLWGWFVFSLSRTTTCLDFVLVRWLSLLLFTAASHLGMLSFLNLGRSTRIGLPKEETVLKTGGVYRFTRNPMYMAFAMFSIAAVLHLREPFAFLLGLYTVVIYHFIILSEENFLEKRFGGGYLDYKRRVRRYL